MVVLMLESVPVGLRGELSRWMIEPRAGVFVGDLSGMVRDKLWEKARRGARGGGAMLLYTSPTEQGFTVRTFGDSSREIIDLEGLMLVHIPTRTRHTAAQESLTDSQDEPAGLPAPLEE